MFVWTPDGAVGFIPPDIGTVPINDPSGVRGLPPRRCDKVRRPWVVVYTFGDLMEERFLLTVLDEATSVKPASSPLLVPSTELSVRASQPAWLTSCSMTAFIFERLFCF